jgi:hypothetical protein
VDLFNGYEKGRGLRSKTTQIEIIVALALKDPVLTLLRILIKNGHNSVSGS